MAEFQSAHTIWHLVRDIEFREMLALELGCLRENDDTSIVRCGPFHITRHARAHSEFFNVSLEGRFLVSMKLDEQSTADAVSLLHLAHALNDNRNELSGILRFFRYTNYNFDYCAYEVYSNEARGFETFRDIYADDFSFKKSEHEMLDILYEVEDLTDYDDFLSEFNEHVMQVMFGDSRGFRA